MKIARIANVAMTVLAVSLLFACQKVKEAETDPSENVTFSVALNSKEATYAEVVVRHTGTDSQSWYGFVTTDLNSSEEDLIKAQLPQVNSKNLHVGKSQTVAIPNLEELDTYRYIAFGTDKDGKRYGTPGSLVFTSSPDYDVTFVTEVESLDSHSATINITHDGNEVLTYRGILTSDMESETSDIIAKDYSDIVKNGKLEEVLLSGTSNSIELKELTHETAYRYIIYGVYVEDEVAVYYGTPAESTFTTPIDLSLVSFSATVSGITTETAKVSVKYDAKQEDLTWYGFVSTDLTTPAETLIAAAVESITAEDYLSGAQQNLDIENLQMETEYRYIATGINSDGVYGIPADVRFTTLSQAYVNTVFSVAASDITTTGATLTITHTGEEEFKYYGFFTEDMDSELADVEVPSNADNNLVSGKEKVITVDNLKPLTAYRYVVVGRVYGNEYGTRGEVVFETADPAIHMNYEEYIGEWKVNGQVFSIVADEEGVSYKIKDFPGSSATRGGVSDIVAFYDADKGQLYVEDQDMGQYNDPSDNNYGPLVDFFAGATWATMSNGSQRYWPNYPFRTTTKSRVFTFVGMEDGTYLMRGAEGVEASTFGWLILSGSNAGGGNSYSGNVVFPATVEKFIKKAATYQDFLGKWTLGSSVITIAPKVNGSTYSITGLFGLENLYGDVHEVIANYDAERHEMYLMEQKLGEFNTADVSSFGNNQYGDCDDFLAGVFSYGGSTYIGYGLNTDEPAIIFSAFINGEDVVELIAGSCSYGPFVGFDYWWIIREGEYAGRGNSYHANGSGYDYEPLPSTMTKTSGSSSISYVRPIAPQAKLGQGWQPALESPFKAIVK